MREANLSGKLTVKKYPENWKAFLEKRAKEINQRRTRTNTQLFVTEANEDEKTPEVTDKERAEEKRNDKDTEKDKKQDSEKKTNETKAPAEPPYEDKVFATNPLSYRISVALLNDDEVVDVSGLLGAGDLEFVCAALVESITQTPHAITLNEARIWLGSRIRFVYAVPDRNLRIKKAEAARNELRRVLKEMNLDSLDDIEKLRRINQWTYLNTEYNYPALDFLHTCQPITPELESNWTTYGPAIDHLAVCEGYSEAFVFLACEAGFEAIGVTGSINGDASVGHKWAAVKINGEWRYFDPTWNDAEGYEERWFNLPVDHPIMTEYYNLDRRYVVSTYINDYR
ncbi:MAG: hypothetical protein Q4D73_01360 [Actinomycetaceae bacterium]|nr:hypothetical protein [Actinomycetaceae bacterium]